MNPCQTCQSTRILNVEAKCDDRSVLSYQGFDKDGYVPNDLNIGGGDYISFNLCLDCGRVQGRFPVDIKQLENAFGVEIP